LYISCLVCLLHIMSLSAVLFSSTPLIVTFVFLIRIHTLLYCRVIMDGNRRYGREKYNCANRGHVDGSKTLVEFSKWCLAEGVQMVTVYAFSTENWNRCPLEINSLMNLLCTYCDELRLEAQKRRIKVQLLSTDSQRVSCLCVYIIIYVCVCMCVCD
jgi:Undecaprenyl pyrophosphate synthase